MKALITSIILFAFNSYGQDLDSFISINTQKSETLKRSEIEQVESDSQGEVNQIELKNGNILYGDEIQSFNFELNTNLIKIPPTLIKLPPSTIHKLKSASSSTRPMTNLKKLGEMALAEVRNI